MYIAFICVYIHIHWNISQHEKAGSLAIGNDTNETERHYAQ